MDAERRAGAAPAAVPTALRERAAAVFDMATQSREHGTLHVAYRHARLVDQRVPRASEVCPCREGKHWQTALASGTRRATAEI
jgi:hypothetical protein